MFSMPQSARWTLHRARNPVFRPHRTVHEPAVPRFRAGGAACGRRLRYTHARYRHARAVFQRCLAGRSSTSAPARTSTAPICTRCSTVCCAIPERHADAMPTWRDSVVRYCGRKHAGFAGLPPACRPEKVSVRRQNISTRELRDELPVLTAEAVYRHFRRTRLNSY